MTMRLPDRYLSKINNGGRQYYYSSMFMFDYRDYLFAREMRKEYSMKYHPERWCKKEK